MSCDYGTMDWYCRLPQGHKEPHESEPLTPPADPEEER